MRWQQVARSLEGRAKHVGSIVDVRARIEGTASKGVRAVLALNCLQSTVRTPSPDTHHPAGPHRKEERGTEGMSGCEWRRKSAGRTKDVGESEREEKTEDAGAEGAVMRRGSGDGGSWTTENTERVTWVSHVGEDGSQGGTWWSLGQEEGSGRERVGWSVGRHVHSGSPMKLARSWVSTTTTCSSSYPGRKGGQDTGVD